MASRNRRAYLLLGSNEGDKLQYLKQATQAIEKRLGKIMSSSKHYETQAWGLTAQEDFINQAVVIETALSVEQLLANIQHIENDLGRVRSEKWASRTIDIDILLFDDIVINKKDLVVPHPHLHERNFALIPLMEIAGDIEHPVLKKTIEDIYFSCTDPSEVILLSEKE